MMRKMLILLIVMALAVPAFAVTQDDIALYRGSGSWFGHYSAGGTMNDPDGHVGTPASVDTSVTGYGFAVPSAKPMLGDINGDGIDDIVVAQGTTGSTQWASGHSIDTGGGVGAFSKATTSSGFLGDAATKIDSYLGDVTGDGIDDIVAVSANFQWDVRPSTSAGLSNVTTNDQNKQFGLTSSDVPIFGDFNGDGMHDIGIWRNSASTFVSLTAGGVVGTGSVVTGALGSAAWDTPLIGDINGDGRDDLVLVDEGGAFSWIVAFAQPNGQLDYTAGHSNIVSFGGTGFGDIPFVADINGDGLDDIGVFRGGQWLAAFTGAGGVLTNAISDGANFGLATDTPLIGQLHVPEPATIALLGLGGLALIRRKRA